MTVDDISDVIANYMVIQCTVRMMNPDSIKTTYLPGVAAILEMNKGNHNNFREAIKRKEMNRLYTGLMRAYAKYSPAAGRMKLAYGMDLALKSRAVMRDMAMFKTNATLS